jgi:hypothetical protein
MRQRATHAAAGWYHLQNQDPERAPRDRVSTPLASHMPPLSPTNRIPLMLFPTSIFPPFHTLASPSACSHLITPPLPPPPCSYSFFPDEDEVLLSPNARFTVANALTLEVVAARANAATGTRT